jgi:hypothetical protein
MKLQHIGAVLAGAAFAAMACRGDPTGSLRGGAKFVDVSATIMFIDAGGGKPVSVVVRDEQQNPLAATVTTATLNAGVATVVEDTTIPSPNGSEHNYIITGVAPGATKVVFSSSGLADTVAVSVLPLSFAGAVSPSAPRGGDTVVVRSTAVLKFDTTVTDIAWGAQAGVLLARTRDSLVYLMPFGVTGHDSVRSADVTYVPGLRATLPLATQIVTTGDRWAPGDTGYASAPTIALPTASGQTVSYLMPVPAVSNDANCAEGIGGGATGKCIIFKYVANGTDSLQFTANWTPATDASDNSDIDVYTCDNTGLAGCFEANGYSAGGSTPEQFSWKPSAGVHYFVIEQYSAGEDPNIVLTITKLN